MRNSFIDRGDLIKIIVVSVLYAAAIAVFAFIEVFWWAKLIVYLILYFAVGYEIIFSAIKNLIKEPFNEDLLMLVASVGAFALGDFPEAVAIMLFFSIGELFEDYADKKSERAIERLYEMIPDTATALIDGKPVEIGCENIAIGDILLVKAGERIAVDGVALGGETYVDTSMITGESAPKKVRAGDCVSSGYIVVGAPLTMEARKIARDSSAEKIIELIKDSDEKKANSERFITRFARIYTPVVILAAIIVAILPPVFGESFNVWAYRAVNLLVISCPCALIVSVPIAFFAGIGNAFGHGIIVKGSAVLERVNKATVFAFDKTGTLTKGEFAVLAVEPVKEKDILLKIAASIEIYSSHPIAKAIVDSFDGERFSVESVKEIAGGGMEAYIEGKLALVGNEKLFKDHGVDISEFCGNGTTAFVFYNGIKGAITVGDGLKETSAKLIEDLKKCGNRSIILTGDNEKSAKTVAEGLGADEYCYSLLPRDKVEIVEKLKESANVCFVGDGINDSPALAAADLSIAMGSGSDVAADCADAVIASDDPMKLTTLKKISKKTMTVVKTNVIGSIAVKLAIFVLSVLGFAPMWLAVFADVGIMILATLNSLRLSSVKKIDSNADQMIK